MITFEKEVFPIYAVTRPNASFKSRKTLQESDAYFIYNIDDEEEIVFNWVDKWFKDNTDSETHSTIWSIKMVDSDTACHLYNRYYNPFSIRIMPQYKNESMFALKAMIHSIDDSSYGAWFNNITYKKALELQDQIAEYINEQKILNGDNFFKFAKEIGANDFDTN